MNQENRNSRQDSSNSRRQNRPNLQREHLLGNKDMSSRRRCPDCDGRIPKESGKPKSRVWKKVMWFTRRSRSVKNDICQCRSDEELRFNSNLEVEKHSNSWSFTRGASRKFRISSRKRKCKSDCFKKTCINPNVRQIEVCTVNESSSLSTRTDSVCSSGANSPTATGSFCDFGASTSQAGWRGSKRHKNTFVLTEIAREINPPLKNEDTFLSNIHPPLKKLSESSSSVSHISRRFTSPVLGNVRRSKSFPGSQGSLSPSKRRFMNTTNKTFASFSPPLKQKCYGLRRTATFSGKLNTELPKTCMKKSKSINNSDLMKLDKTSSLGEIRDQSGSIIGIVHFYKSPNKVAARRMSGINHELNKDRIFVEEESEHETVDRTSSNFISTRLPPNQTISESQKDVSFEPECTAFDKANKRADCEERFKAENIKSSCSCALPEHILKPVVSIETLSKLSHIKEELSESALCDNTCNISVAVNANKPVEEMGVDISGDHKVKNTNQNDCVDTSDFEAQVTAVLNSQDCSEGTKHVVENISATNASSDIELSNPMTKEKSTSGYAEEFKTKVSEPGLVKDGSSTTKATNVSNLEFFSAKPDDHMSDGSHDSSDLLKEQPCTHSSKDVGHSLNCMSDNCHGCDDYHSNQQLAQPVSKLALETGSEIPVNGTMFPIDSTVYSDACLSSQSICVDTKTEHPGDHLRISTSKVKLNCSSVCTSVSSAPENLRKDTLCLKCMEEEKEVTLSQNHKSCLVVDGQFGGVLSEAEKNDEKSCRGVALNGFNGETSYIEPVSEETGLCQGIATDDLKLSGGTKHNSASKIGKADSDFAFETVNSGTNSVKPTNKGIDFYQENPTDSMEFSDEIKLRSNLAREPVLSSNDDTFEVFDSEARCRKATSEEMELFRKSPNDRKLFNAEKLSPRFHTCEEIASDLDNGLEVFCSPTASSSMKPSGLYEDLSNETATGLRYSPQKSLSYEKSQLRRNSGAITSPGSLERSKTSDYASMLDESFSDYPEDVPIHTWKTSESDLKSEELTLPVPGETFKMRTELMLSWFQEFNDEQRNIILKKILGRCELPQMHLLSVAMENNLHKTCPPNCQDMLVWLPYTVTLQILMYLDAVSLCRCNQVNRAWNELADNPLLWQRLTRNPDYQLCEASSRRQLTKFTHANGEIHWKKVFAERFLLQRNWLNGKYDLRTYEGHNQGIACVQFDDTRIVSGSYDKTIKLWDISNMPSELMLTLEGHSGTVRCLDLNGNRLVSGSTDRTIKVWDLSFASYWAGASCKVTMVGHLHTVRCLQADEKKLVSGSYDKTVKVWDLKTGVCQLTLRGHTAAVLCVQFDDQKIVSGSYDKKIKVWDLTEGTCLMTLDGHQDAVTCLNLTHDGMKIITGSLDYSLKFWDLSTGKCYGTLDWITSEGHTAVVRCLQVDSWRIISGGDDKTLKVWELATGQRLLTLRYHSDGVTCMQFNDFAIVSGSYDRTVKLWDFTPKHPYLEAIT